MQKYKPYKKTDAHSYAIGIFPTIELLSTQPEKVEVVFIASNSDHSQGVQKIKSLCRTHHIACVEDAKTIMRVARDSHGFALGVFTKSHTQLDPNLPHVVLASPDDTGNLGTILRTMLAFGHRDVAIISPAVDHFDPKVVRASMGASFKQRVRYFTSFDAYMAAFPNHHIYPFVLQTNTLLKQTAFRKPYSLVFGNEGSGLPEAFKAIGTPVRIEQTSDVDSLNLAMSVGIALHAAFTQE